MNRSTPGSTPIRGADITTFRLGGPLPRFADARNVEEARDAFRAAHARGLPARIIGSGSNLLISDAGFGGAVIRWLAPSDSILQEDDAVVVSGGAELDALARFCAERGLEGLTFATGIPGTVAGALVGNAGAFGESIGDRLVSVRVFHPVRGIEDWPREAIRFAYRDSSLRGAGVLVESVRLRVSRGDPTRLVEERARILEWRRARHPDWRAVPCAGSFFKNIEPSSAAERRRAAGWFLEQVGAKAMRVGGAAVYEKHANIIIKASENCTAQDVWTLSLRMAEAVHKAFGLRLQREVELIGPFGPAPDQVSER